MKLTLTQLHKNLTLGETEPIYFFTGEDVFRKKEVAEQIIKIVNPDDFNLSREDAQNTDIGQLLTLANTAPVFSVKRVIVLDNADKIKKNAVESFCKYLQNPLESTVLIIFHNDSKKFKKDFSLQDCLEQKSTTITFDELKGPTLLKWITDKLKQNGLQADHEILMMMTDLIGADLTALTKEIEKLSLMLQDREDKNLTSEDLLSSIGYSKEENPFALNNALLDLDKKTALKLVDNLLKTGEEPISVLNKISACALKLFRIKRLSEANLSSSEIIANAGMLPWESRLISRAGALPKSEVMLKVLDKIIEVDMSLKSSSADDPAISLKAIVMMLLPK